MFSRNQFNLIKTLSILLSSRDKKKLKINV
jgi:hypothetical protein